MATCCKTSASKLLGNTGTSNKMPAPGIAKRVFRIPLYTDAGVRNGIDLSQIGDAAYMNGLINQADPSARLSPLPKSVTIARTQADNLSESYDDGSIANTFDGVISLENTIAGINASPAMAREIKNDECVAFGEYIVDVCGNFNGGSVENGILYPREVNTDSVDVRYMPNEYAAKQKIMVSYQYDVLVDDADFYTVNAEDIGIDLLKVQGLKALKITLDTPLTTGVKATVTTIFGYDNDLEPVTGLLPGEFTALNVTQSSAITVTAAAEGPDGVYALTYDVGDQPSSADVVEVYVTKATLSPDDRDQATTP